MKWSLQILAIVLISSIGLIFTACQQSNSDSSLEQSSPNRVVIEVDNGIKIGVDPEAHEKLKAYRSHSAPEPAFYHFGRAATKEEITAWDIDIPSDGHGLPDGSGNVEEGAVVFAIKCAVCHGINGEGIPPNGALVATGSNGKTIGSFWPHATTVFDYIRRAMPFNAPDSLTDQEVYSLTAFLLHKNGIITEDTIVDSGTLPQIKMPNAKKFVPDDRERYNSVH